MSTNAVNTDSPHQTHPRTMVLPSSRTERSPVAPGNAGNQPGEVRSGQAWATQTQMGIARPDVQFAAAYSRLATSCCQWVATSLNLWAELGFACLGQPPTSSCQSATSLNLWAGLEFACLGQPPQCRQRLDLEGGEAVGPTHENLLSSCPSILVSVKPCHHLQEVAQRRHQAQRPPLTTVVEFLLFQ